MSELDDDPQMSAQQLLRRARRWLWLTLLPLLGLVLLLAAWQAWAQWQKGLDTAAAELRSQRHAFESIARDTDNHVADLHHWMQREYLRSGEPVAPAVAQAFQPRHRADGSADGYSLDALPQLLRDGMGQLLWPQDQGRPPAAVLQRAQALSAVIETAHQRNPDFAWSYFFGLPEKHILLFPWVRSNLAEDGGAPDLSTAVKAWYDYEVVTAGMAAANPARLPYWTAPYIDAGGQGLLVSHATPLYLGDDQLGIVGTDIKLGTLEGLLDRLPGSPWKAWAVDQRGHLLADRQQPVAEAAAVSVSVSVSAANTAASSSTGVAATSVAAAASAASTAAPSMAQLLPLRLPAGVDMALVRQAAASPGQPVSAQGQLLMAIDVRGAPWTLVLAAPRSELLLAVVPQVLPFSLIALGLLAVWAVAQALLRQRILNPVLELLGYLQRLSADPAATEPNLGTRWQAWVQVVTRTFAQLRSSTQREQRAEALKSAIVDHAQAALMVADEAGRVVEFNPAAEALIGCSRDQALGKTMVELLIPERFQERFAWGLRQMRDGDRAGLMGRRLPRVVRRADGSELPVEVVMWMTRVDGTAFYTASVADLTEARAAAEVIERQRDALRQSEKLTAMGSLLAGVAHELNNPLAIVMGRASLLEEKTEGTPLQADATRIRAAAERCGRIVRTFLNMARSRPAQRGSVQLNDLVLAAADMLGYTLRSHGIELELRLAAPLPEVQADGDQIGQVVLNLIVNAQQALAAHTGLRRISISSGSNNGGVWLQVTDSGPGVPEALRDKIFEPFFTTKADGMGTGLGLSVSRGIVREHGGELALIVATLQPGTGASLTLSLPLQAAAPTVATQDMPTPVASQGGGRVLVVDDEPEITDLLRSMLESAGFEVACADSGAVALEMLATANFAAIVSDLRMPDMDGAALWRAVREKHPALATRMLFVTGDTLSPGARQFLDDAACPRLDKPFSRADLLARLAQVLQGAQAPSASNAHCAPQTDQSHPTGPRHV